jgi:hypothetical protein
MVGIGSIWGPVEGSCEHGNEPSGSIKRWELLEWLHNWQLLKKGSAPWVSEWVSEGGGVHPGSTRHVCHWMAYCACPGWLWWWRIWWTEDWGGGETEVLGENLPQRHSVYHKSHLTRPGLEPGPPRWEASDQPLSYGAGLPFGPKYGDNTILRNVDELLPVYTALHSRKWVRCVSKLWESQFNSLRVRRNCNRPIARSREVVCPVFVVYW